MTRGLDYEELLASRSAVMRGLAEDTDRTDYATDAARKDRVGVGLSSSFKGTFPERDIAHRELVVTEGRKAVPAPQLQSQDHLEYVPFTLSTPAPSPPLTRCPAAV